MHRLLWQFAPAPALRGGAPFSRRLVLVAALLSAAAGTAVAQSAKELYDQGTQALNAGKFSDAVTAFDASYRKEPTPNALYNLGLAYKGWGKPDKALEAFEGYIKFANPKKDKATIDAVRGEIERLKAGFGRFALKLTPAEAVIDIDGVRTTPSGNDLWVATGKHKISVSAPNYESYEQTLDVAPGRYDLEVHLREPSGPPEARAAALVDEGMALQAGGNAQGALDKYNAAHAIFPTARGTAQKGLAEEMLGDYGSAEPHIKEALKARKDPWIKENKKKLNASLRHMKKDAVTLDVTGDPLGTEVFLNDRSVGVLPLPPMRIGSGHIVVRAMKQGYTPYEEEIDVLPRAKRQMQISLSESPKPPPVVALPPPPEPVAALPPPEPVVVAPPPEKTPPPETTNQADIEAMAEAQREAAGEPHGQESATGFEAALNFGYQLWIGGPKFNGSSGAIMPQILLGARVPWFLSFGLALQGSYDGGNDTTKFIVNANPGFYVRGHIQQYKKALGFDAWLGTGIQPVAVQVAVLKPEKLDLNTIDPNSLDQAGQDALARALGSEMAGVDLVHTIQSINIPIELGGTFFITEGLGIDLAMALTFWLPQQSCLHDENDRLCSDKSPNSQTSFFIGGGLSFLP
jgi:tetratricopeptide (TPR) repeat protein